MTLDLDKLENLHQSTTPGPWHIRKPMAHLDGGFVEAPRLDPKHPYDIEVLGEDDSNYPTRDADMAWIVAAHEAFPVMLERIRALTDALLVAQADFEQCEQQRDAAEERANDLER